ncbi:MAG: formyltransferase family protein [Pyrinomonadaceae bacterium]
MSQKLSVILLTHGGAEKVIEELTKIRNVEIAGVFIETQITVKRSLPEKIKRSIRYDGFVQTFKKFFSPLFNRKTSNNIENLIADARQATIETAGKLKIPVHQVENYHLPDAINLLQKTNADLGIIFGTNIVKKSVFEIPRLGSINLHQGLAPFYRGGPTVFWELFNDEKELGITVHFVAPKVDTGDIILQKTFPLDYDFSIYGTDYEKFLADYRAGLREPSAQLIAEAVSLIAEGREQRKTQDTSLGKRYRLPLKKEKDELKKHLRKRFKKLNARN